MHYYWSADDGIRRVAGNKNNNPFMSISATATVTLSTGVYQDWLKVGGSEKSAEDSEVW